MIESVKIYCIDWILYQTTRESGVLHSSLTFENNIKQFILEFIVDPL